MNPSVDALMMDFPLTLTHFFEYYEKVLGVPIVHAWGMTETSPIGTIGRLKSYIHGWPDESRYAARAKQGYVAAGVELRIVGGDGRELAPDGRSMGEIQVRGPWVVGAYYDNPESASRFTEDGWFKTGDVATVDAEGYLQITDRTKDLIKSGGEWISSVDVENMIMAHPNVLEAAVIAVPHPKWMERPLACGALLDSQAKALYSRAKLTRTGHRSNRSLNVEEL